MWAFAHMESLLAAVRAIQESVGVRVTFTWMTLRDFSESVEEGEKWTKEKI